jgi:hypothetical protein
MEVLPGTQKIDKIADSRTHEEPSSACHEAAN